jgi:hypothetical protein
MRILIVLMSLISLATVSSPTWAQKKATPLPAPAPIATTGNIFDDITDSVSQASDSFGDALQLSGKEIKGLGENTADGASKVEHGSGKVIDDAGKTSATGNAGDGVDPRPTAR